ncbi:hypothetical protein AADZ84_04060 [Colwelliaceae bacterium MEBiC 14330]
MLKYLIIIILLFSVVGCNAEQEVQALNSNLNNEKVWVFAQFNVREEANGLESYYYYAKITKSLYNEISQNKLQKGFIYLESVKYWGENDLIYDYADGENAGELIFRIEDIAKIDLVKVEPIIGKGIEQFDLKSKSEVNGDNKTLTKQ